MTTDTLTADVLSSWLDRYGAAWEGLDPDAAAALFTDDARYYDTPYADGYEGASGVRDYWAAVTADQQGVDFTYEVIGVVGSTGVARWNSKLTVASSGTPLELDGVFLLQFDGDLCRELREWWHIR